MHPSLQLNGLDLATHSAASSSSSVTFGPKSYRREVVLDIALPSRLSRPSIKQHSVLFTYAPISSSGTWHIRLTFSAAWDAAATYKSRVSASQHLIRRIRLDRLPLLRDTVSEIVISTQHDAATLLRLPLLPATESNSKLPDDLWLCGSWYYIREDSSRVRFPWYIAGTGDYVATRTLPLSSVSKERLLAPGVSVVRVAGEPPEGGKLYVYKEIERPLYGPDDTRMIELELHHLERLRVAALRGTNRVGSKHVVRLVAAIISDNPYRTASDVADKEGVLGEEQQQTVLRGLLLEYYPNGSLEDALSAVPGETSGVQPSKKPWYRWALHVASGLQHLHAHRLAHMDLKPANVVISNTEEAVIIDISGWAGTYDYLAPEVRDTFDLSQLDFEVRMKNDCWALGRLFERLAVAANADGQSADGRHLRAVAVGLMAPDPARRLGITEAVAVLEGCDKVQNDGFTGETSTRKRKWVEH